MLKSNRAPSHERLRALRIEAGLSQQKVADAVGASRQWVTDLESGKLSIRDIALCRAAPLARALKTTVTGLLK